MHQSEELHQLLIKLQKDAESLDLFLLNITNNEDKTEKIINQIKHLIYRQTKEIDRRLKVIENFELSRVDIITIYRHIKYALKDEELAGKVASLHSFLQLKGDRET